MRPRKWVLITSFFCLLIIVALHLGKRHLEKNRDLEILLIQSISPFVEGTIDVRKIRLGFFSAHLYGVSLQLSASGSIWNIETLTGYYRKSFFKINGTWDAIDAPYAYFNFSGHWMLVE